MNKESKIKIAIIAGASSGIGRVSALRLAKEGCHLFLIARRKAELEKLVSECQSAGVKAIAHPCDLTDHQALERAAAIFADTFGKADILVSTAGTGFLKPFKATNIEDFRSLWEINTLGTIFLCHMMIPLLNEGGSIILITSPAGIHGAKAMTAYACSKGGIVPFGKSLALELAPLKIRVNVIAPGYVETDMTRKLYNHLNRDQLEGLVSLHPLGAGKLEDVASAIYFLAADESAWITGVVLPVDGGFGAGI